MSASLFSENKIPSKPGIIKCPHCGAEYIPAEIYSTLAFTGKPDNLVKDPTGRIIYVDYVEGKEQDLEEHFICEYCDKAFQVEGTLNFKTKAEKEELDFSDTSSSLI